MLSAIAAALSSSIEIRGRLWLLRNLAERSPAVLGPLLLVGGAVLTGIGTGRLSWLSILSGAVCLLVYAYHALLSQLRESLRLRSAWNRDPLLSQEDLAKLIAVDVTRRVTWDIDRYKIDVQGMTLHLRRAVSDLQSVSAQTETLYDTLTNQVERRLASWQSRDFHDFAGSMVRNGIWAPVSVYTSAEDGAGLKNVVVAVLREFALVSAVEEPPVLGSWFQRLWIKSQAVAESPSVHSRLARLEEAIALEHLGKRRAEIDKEKAESVAALLSAIKEQENAVVRIGSIIAIKAQGDLVVWTIGEMEAAALEKNGDLLVNPVAALKFLRENRDAQELRRSQDLANRPAAPQ